MNDERSQGNRPPLPRVIILAVVVLAACSPPIPDAPPTPRATTTTTDPIADLADYLDLQSDAEYCAEFPEDRACNGTDP